MIQFDLQTLKCHEKHSCYFRFGYVNNAQANPEMVYVPLCKYNSEQEGIEIRKYNEKFCEPKAFQPTFNEYGMCFTYNNRKQGMDEYFRLHNSMDANENLSNSNTHVAIGEDAEDEIVKVCCNQESIWLS